MPDLHEAYEAVCAVKTVAELEFELQALRDQDFMNQCADNAYGISGRMETMQQLIRAKERDLAAAREREGAAG